MSRIEKLLEFLKETPADSFLQHALALEYIKAGDDSKAKNHFESLLKADPGYIGSYYHLGKLYEREGDLVAALSVYSKGMEEAKKNKDMHAFQELQAALEDISD